MSPSRSPTAAPVAASAAARLAETVDFPTPPLPLPIAITWATPSSALRSAVGSLGLRTRETVWIATSRTPGTVIAADRHSLSSWPLSGHAAVVSTSVKATFPSVTARSSIIPSETRSRWRSGSWTLERAFRISSWRAEGMDSRSFLGPTRCVPQNPLDYDPHSRLSKPRSGASKRGRDRRVLNE